MKCASCGAPLGADFRFCGQCGHPVSPSGKTSTADLYDRAYFDRQVRGTIPSAKAVAEAIVREINPSSVVDVGCGTGVYLEQLQSRSLEVLGIENAPAALERSRISPRLILRHDLRGPLHLDRHFDLALSFEVAEHLEAQYAERLVESLCSLADKVLFTAAVPGQGGVHHVNEQPWEYWLALFWQRGYELEVARTARLRQQCAEGGALWWFQNNLAVLSRSAYSPEALAHSLRLVESIEGWLSPAEIQFLFSAARQADSSGAIVEIGSWKGRSAAALGLGALAGAGASVFAIDHHRGSVEYPRRLNVLPAEIWSWPEFHSNMQALCLEDVVTPLIKDSLVAEASWDGPPIALLWIDGAHDYESAAGDLAAWSRHLRPGGVIAFHDTTRREGTRRAVREAIARGQLQRPVQIDSIIYGLAPETAPEPAREYWSFPALPPRRQRHDRISLIMPTRNEGDHLRKTIDSLLENTFYPDLEVLIMDDASEDGSGDFLADPPYADDQRLRHIRAEQHQGHLPLRIEAARLATGSVLQFLDSHHSFSPYWLTNLYDSLRRRGFQALVGPVMSTLDPATWQLTGAISYGWGLDTTLRGSWHLRREEVGPEGRVPWLAGHQVMMHREVYETIGGLSPLFRIHGFNDRDLCVRAYLFGYDCYIEPSAIVGHVYKRGFINPITVSQKLCNYFIHVYLNLGQDNFEQIRATEEQEHGYAGAMKLFERLRPEVEQFRDWIVRHQSRSADDLLAWLAQFDRRPRQKRARPCQPRPSVS